MADSTQVTSKEIENFINEIQNRENHQTTADGLMKKYSLTRHQAEIMLQILDSIKAGNHKIILRGSAGVGKTYLVQALVTEYRAMRKKGMVYITAPTNRAVSVLKDKQPNAPYYTIFSTIHKALFLKRFINDKTGVVTFKPDYNPSKEKPFAHGCIAIVDEASMLNSELLFYLEEPEYDYLPMIFLGDDKQLNPVNEQDSPIFNRREIYEKDPSTLLEIETDKGKLSHKIPKYEEFELTEIIRQKENNPIINVSRNLSLISLQENILSSHDEGIEFTSDLKKCAEIIINNENSRYLAWTNNEVNRVNTIIRNKIFTTPAKVELGETIIFAEPYEGAKNSYWSNYELKIEKLDIRQRNFTAVKNFVYEDNTGKNFVTIENDLQYYLINDDVMVVHESSIKDFMNMMHSIKQLTRFGLSWKAWFGFGETFAKIGYRYAVTVHKSQGGTFDTVVINMKDLNLNRNNIEKKRLWYTGITRASKKVLIYVKPMYEGDI